jgi:hypothetical protein
MKEFEVAYTLLLHLLVSGLLALFIRELYRRFSVSLSNKDAFSAVFMPLTVTTALVITVVKSSLALSLGLVGALSIVRFRAAIKDPEELVYLFFCIAVGLTLGAGRLVEAIVGVLVFTLLIITVHYIQTGRRSRNYSLLLTITGDKRVFFGDKGATFHDVIDKVAGPSQIQRFEHDDGQVQFRATITPGAEKDITAMMAELEEKLPGCQISYVNLQNLL